MTCSQRMKVSLVACHSSRRNSGHGLVGDSLGSIGLSFVRATLRPMLAASRTK